MNQSNNQDKTPDSEEWGMLDVYIKRAHTLGIPV